ncbi:kynureninase [Limimaricola pyoseonensis]|uniref:Kynureninase n=1 Tax=Limimaricola pyoseonensis TaxID=521013 RepID=A0A1G7L436_9RHOB|nr:kynureninase [Limimaricola pyoseonensis]SDF44277.1 Kynureninase [Limimaricola pyoseonensis]
MSDATALPQRDLFDLPEGVVYLDGNSLGPLPRGTAERLSRAVGAEWGAQLVRGWNDAGWIDLPDRVAARIAPLIGAEPGTVAVGDSTSVNLFKVLAAAMALNPERRVILSDAGNFPTDLYIADGICRFRGEGWRVEAKPSEEVEAAIDESVAVLMLTQVDYRTGRRRDMRAVTEKAHAAGAVVIWDLAHSAGAFPVELAACGADFAIGCGYKFLNGGPGAPAFLYVAPRHAATVEPVLSGWMGHAAPFAFDPGYRPGEGVERMKVGTPPILSMTALEDALRLFEGRDLAALETRAQDLCDHFIAAVEARCPGLVLATPRDRAVRGSHVSFRHPEGYAVMQALIAQGVIGDFRAPDILRFGITPLYIGEADLDRAAEVLGEILDSGSWDRPEFHARAKVT